MADAADLGDHVGYGKGFLQCRLIEHFQLELRTVAGIALAVLGRSAHPLNDLLRQLSEALLEFCIDVGALESHLAHRVEVHAVICGVLGLVDAVEQGIVDLVQHGGKCARQVFDGQLLALVQNDARVALAPVLA